MATESAAQILDRIRAGYFLPSLSVVATSLIEIASRETSTIDDLAALLRQDPSLTVRIIKLANSAFMRGAEPVTTVEQAIFKVGFNRLRIMALSLSLKDTFPMLSQGPLDYETFWRVSLYKGMLAKALAQRLRNANPDESFVAGFTLEIGLLILFDLLVKGRDETVKLTLYPLRDLLSLEKRRYGIDHREIGEAALTHWKMPAGIIACQRAGATGSDLAALPPLCYNCALAGELSAVIFQKSVGLSAISETARTTYGLSEEVVHDVIASTFEEVEEIAASLNVELNKQKDMLDIMEKANAALAALTDRLSAEKERAAAGGLQSFESLGREEDRKAVQHTLEAVAHEIRNPLTSVGGFVRRLASTLTPSSQGWEYAQIIIEETQKLEQALSRMSQQFPRT